MHKPEHKSDPGEPIEHAKQSGWQSDSALIMLAVMWGTSHVITKDILATHSPAFYTSMRFGIAAVFFLLMFSNHVRRSSSKEIFQGVLLGLCSFTGIAFYVAGLVFTRRRKRASSPASIWSSPHCWDLSSFRHGRRGITLPG
ncbi:MAG: DMT family transporter [Acidobacteria bacterium]|nr:DMT family transporter [Acidobacteriota bacterium]